MSLYKGTFSINVNKYKSEQYRTKRAKYPCSHWGLYCNMNRTEQLFYFKRVHNT